MRNLGGDYGGCSVVWGMSTVTVPKVGMLATKIVGSDTYGGKISHVSPSGAYVLFMQSNGREERFNRNKRGEYCKSTMYLKLGTAEDYRDSSF